MLQGLPIALAQLNTNNTSEKLYNPSNHIFFCIEQKKSLNKYIAIWWTQ